MVIVDVNAQASQLVCKVGVEISLSAVWWQHQKWCWLFESAPLSDLSVPLKCLSVLYLTAIRAWRNMPGRPYPDSAVSSKCLVPQQI
jgi:hypothetical protein